VICQWILGVTNVSHMWGHGWHWHSKDSNSPLQIIIWCKCFLWSMNEFLEFKKCLTWHCHSEDTNWPSWSIGGQHHFGCSLNDVIYTTASNYYGANNFVVTCQWIPGVTKYLTLARTWHCHSEHINWPSWSIGSQHHLCYSPMTKF